MSKPWPQVAITDETLRDGLQIERLGVSIDEKIELLNLLVMAGLRRIVVGAFVSPKWSPQMADTQELLRRIQPVDGVDFFALALNEKGRKLRSDFAPPLTIESIPATHLHLCEVFLLRNTNRSIADQDATWRLPIEKAVSAGSFRGAIGLSAPWGSNWTGKVEHSVRIAALQRQYDAWVAAGIEVVRVDLADPMGWNTPAAVAEDLAEIKRRFPSITDFHLHLHNARGMAMLSIYEALKCLDDADTLIADTALGGIGGCPYCGNGQATGMIPTEDFVQLLATLGIDTGISLNKLIEASSRLATILGRPLSSQVARNGPLPSGSELYSRDMPTVYTFEQAQHFRLGPSTYQGNPRPWLRD